jgi:hypothetical protein
LTDFTCKRCGHDGQTWNDWELCDTCGYRFNLTSNTSPDDPVKIELLPCRMCGGAAAFEEYSEGVWVVCCTKHYCKGLPICGAGSKEEAAKEWNAWAEIKGNVLQVCANILWLRTYRWTQMRYTSIRNELRILWRRLQLKLY